MGIFEEIQNRILILDGAMGTMLQKGLTEEEALQAYVDAGADIITTNTFNTNSISQAALCDASELPSAVGKAAFESAAAARRVADRAPRKVWVAGSLGPTGKSLTLASDADDPSYRQYGFDDFVECYKAEAQALLEGGADLFIFETAFDAANVKAGVRALELLNNPLPVIISATVSDLSGRTLTGQTLEAFYRSIEHTPNLLAFGINCALGAEKMALLAREISGFSHHALSYYPNAGIPDENGNYNDSPELMADIARGLAADGVLNIAGGCCGTTPEHIRALADALRPLSPRRTALSLTQPVRDGAESALSLTRTVRDGSGAEEGLCVSGLEAVRIDRKRNFTNIGERTNVAGSKKFARLIAESKYDEALSIAAAQVEGGADIIDINMDDPMVDPSEKMRVFLRHIAGEPAVAKAAVMIDSSHWETIVEGLKNVQGKSIVNSISLKEGEEEFVRKALTIKSFGAAMVVMAFDEQGQAVTFERKIGICERSYRLLTAAGIPATDIIFDVNVLSIGTGIAEHSKFGVDFIRAVEWIKKNLPGALTSGGISNLSFAFRGNNRVREAMHSVFLYHAIKAGLDMAIVNPQMLQIYDEIDPDLRKAVEDVIFDTDAEATSRLVEMASKMLEEASAAGGQQTAPERSPDPCGRLSEDVVKGISDGLAEDTMECLAKLGTAVSVIEGPLMDGMERVGSLFSEGKMFLPQVVKSAKIMRNAVAVLQPYMGSTEEGSGKPKFVIATVQGDVHDIGKNITSIVLQCSGFEVIDLGVMVPCSVLLDKAAKAGASIIGVSGLITPSLARMEEICREMTVRGLDIPLFVGGAAASAVHTAVRLSPAYANVHYGSDASSTAVMAKKYITAPEAFLASEKEAHDRLRGLHSAASQHAPHTNNKNIDTAKGNREGFLSGNVFQDIPLTTLGWDVLEKHFDWRLFFGLCGIKPDGCSCCQDRYSSPAATATKAEALDFIQRHGISATVDARFFSCSSDGNAILSESFKLPMLRDSVSGHSLCDFIPSDGQSQMGLFAIKVDAVPADANELVFHALTATLAEAASEYLRSVWAKGLPEGFKLINPAVGYPCCPDHSLKRDILALLDPALGITLTDSCAMIPEASICGLVLAHRDAAYHDIRTVNKEALDVYAAQRRFSPSEKALFLAPLQ